jgi:zinc protease
MIPKHQRVTPLLLLIMLFFFGFPMGAGLVSAMPRVDRTVLPNGLVLLVAEEKALPLVTVNMVLDSGSRRDSTGKEGLAYQTLHGLMLGTRSQSVTEFNEALDFMGASMTATAGRDIVTLRLRALSKDFEEAFTLFMGALTQPSFPDDELQKQIERTRASIQSAKERPSRIAQKAFQATLFPKSPYGHPIDGTEASLEQITRDGVLDFYKSFYHPNNAILAIVGDITLDALKTTVVPLLSRWPKADVPKEPSAPAFTQGPLTVAIDQNITQTNILFGHRGVDRTNPDYYALTVMNYILGGGGFGSRLFEEVRVSRGLAYSIVSYFDLGKSFGIFKVHLQTKNASAKEAIALIQQEIARIQNEGVLEEELEKAKKYQVGSFPLRIDTQAELANFITDVEYYSLGLDYPVNYPSYINAVTRQDVLRVAQTYLHPEEAILVVVGNLKEAGMDQATDPVGPP